MSKYTQKTLKYMRDLGYSVGMVERFIRFPPPGRRVDLYGIIDLLACDENSTIGVQSCGQDFREHQRKIMDGEYTAMWISNNDRELWVIGWRKLLKKKGGKLRIWVPRVARLGWSGAELAWLSDKQ
jgi:hypothetical protein